MRRTRRGCVGGEAAGMGIVRAMRYDAALWHCPLLEASGRHCSCLAWRDALLVASVSDCCSWASGHGLCPERRRDEEGGTQSEKAIVVFHGPCREEAKGIVKLSSCVLSGVGPGANGNQRQTLLDCGL